VWHWESKAYDIFVDFTIANILAKETFAQVKGVWLSHFSTTLYCFIVQNGSLLSKIITSVEVRIIMLIFLSG